jgi:hypothetical protein
MSATVIVSYSNTAGAARVATLRAAVPTYRHIDAAKFDPAVGEPDGTVYEFVRSDDPRDDEMVAAMVDAELIDPEPDPP